MNSVMIDQAHERNHYRGKDKADESHHTCAKSIKERTGQTSEQRRQCDCDEDDTAGRSTCTRTMRKSGFFTSYRIPFTCHKRRHQGILDEIMASVVVFQTLSSVIENRSYVDSSDLSPFHSIDFAIRNHSTSKRLIGSVMSIIVSVGF